MVSRASLYLMLAVLGLLLPYVQFVPWVAQHGLNLSQLAREVAGSRISAFAWADVVVSALAVMAFAVWESCRLGLPFPLWPVLGCLLVGPSFGLPLFLWQREKRLVGPP